MSALQRRMLAAAALLSVSLAACSDSTSPSTVDAVALRSSLSAATSTFQNNAAFQSVSVLSASFPQFAAVGIAIPTLNRIVHSPRRPATRAFPVASILNGTQALFPSNVLGKTLQWDTATSQYIVGAMTGAPATGVRILLYIADPATGTPTPSLSVLGYLDLTDLSTPQVNEIGVLLRLASTTIAEYTITVISGLSTASAEAKGYMKDGTATTQVGFDLLNTLTQTGLVTANDLTGSDGAAIHVEVGIGIANDNMMVRLARGHNSLELTAAGDFLNGTGALTGDVKFNGFGVGTLGGSPNAPTITGTNGHNITAVETTALLGIFVAALSDVLDVSDGIFSPGVIVFNH